MGDQTGSEDEMSEWINLEKEFPRDKGALYLVRTTRPAEGNYQMYYLCTVKDCTWIDGKPLELSGLDSAGRRFCIYENRKPDRGQTADLFGAVREVIIEWKEVEK